MRISNILSLIHYIIHYTICGTVCFQFTHSPCDDWEKIYTLSYFHHQIGSMNYYPLFRVSHETMVCAVCLSIFLLENGVILQSSMENWSWLKCMMTSSNGIFFALLALCAQNSPVTGEFPSQRPVTRSFDVFFHLCQNKRLSKQSWGRWFETPPRWLWSNCNVLNYDRFSLIVKIIYVVVKSMS